MSATKKLRCVECGIADTYPEDFTQEHANDWCKVCRFHRHHIQDFDYHPRCAVCRAREWRGWLQALRILVFRPIAIQPEDL